MRRAHADPDCCRDRTGVLCLGDHRPTPLLGSAYALGLVLPPTILLQVPAGTYIHDFGSLARFASPAQEWLLERRSRSRLRR
jgi:hypothetical protein